MKKKKNQIHEISPCASLLAYTGLLLFPVRSLVVLSNGPHAFPLGSVLLPLSVPSPKGATPPSDFI